MCGHVIVYSQIETVASGRVRTVQEWGGGADDVTDAEDEAGRVDHWREEMEMRTALANAALNMPATSAGQTDKLFQTITNQTFHHQRLKHECNNFLPLGGSISKQNK